MIEQGNGRKIYVAGPMRGIKDFNAPAFDRASAMLREYGWIVFSPAERDREKYGANALHSEKGEMADASKHGITEREVINADLDWITREADALYMLRGWEYSSGAFTEWTTARFLRLHFFYET